VCAILYNHLFDGEYSGMADENTLHRRLVLKTKSEDVGTYVADSQLGELSERLDRIKNMARNQPKMGWVGVLGIGVTMGITAADRFSGGLFPVLTGLVTLIISISAFVVAFYIFLTDRWRSDDILRESLEAKALIEKIIKEADCKKDVYI
jgi:hypothetical protein